MAPGTDPSRVGHVEAAHGGTLFLDVRIVSATNRDLRAEIARGRVREDYLRERRVGESEW